MRDIQLYEEITNAKWITIIFSLTTIVFLIVFIYLTFIDPLRYRSEEGWNFLFLFLLFLGITINFRKFIIVITTEYILVSFGIFRNKLYLDDIKLCYLDDVSAFRYGGWGIRISRVKGNWRLVYNVIGSSRVVFLTSNKIFKEFVCSTRNPEQIIKIINDKLNLVNN
jgi:hypothetical protein